MADIERLRSALKPFAEIPLWRDAYPDAHFDAVPEALRGYVTVEQVRSARAALHEQEGDQG